MKREIDITNWNRKEHFEFFSSMDDPFFGVTVQVDCKRTYEEAKEKGISFFILSLHKILQAVNSVENFHYRLEEGKVFCYDTIHGSCTIGRADETFGFSFFEYIEEEELFVESCIREIEHVKSASGLCFSDRKAKNDMIYMTTTPWFSFTELKHAGSFKTGDSIPRISTGRFEKVNERLLMPINILAHHGMMDGIHVAKFVEKLQELL